MRHDSRGKTNAPYHTPRWLLFPLCLRRTLADNVRVMTVQDEFAVLIMDSGTEFYQPRCPARRQFPHRQARVERIANEDGLEKT